MRINLTDVSKFFKKTAALCRVSLEIPAGMGIAVRGPNGSGKSTLLSICAGLLAPSSGTVCIDTLPIKTWLKQEGRSQVGYLGRDLWLYAHLTALENLELQMRFLQKFQSHLSNCVQTRLEQIVDDLSLASFLNKRLADCSLGMSRRVALARVFLSDPGLIVLDEPYQGLDEEGREMLGNLLLRSKQAGKSFMIAGHDAELVTDSLKESPHGLSLIDRVFELERGQVRSSSLLCQERRTNCSVL